MKMQPLAIWSLLFAHIDGIFIFKLRSFSFHAHCINFVIFTKMHSPSLFVPAVVFSYRI